MIRTLRGVVEEKGPDYVVMNVGGVGFLCHVTPASVSSLPQPGAEAKVYTHLHVREDDLSLYAFASMDELRMFELLLGVSGIGPRVGLGIVSSIPAGDFYKAVLFEDEEALTTVPGIGRKTAQRLILELRDRIGVKKKEGPRSRQGIPRDITGQAEEALTALGYTRGEAAEAVRRAKEGAGDDVDLEQLIHLGLKNLAKV